MLARAASVFRSHFFSMRLNLGLSLGLSPHLVVAAGQLLLTLSTKSHGRLAILNMVHQTYNTFITNPPLVLGSNEKLCLENVRVDFVLGLANYSKAVHAASECRINMSLRFRAVILPTFNIHDVVHRNQDPVDAELSSVILQRSADEGVVLEPQFDDLNYGHECAIEFQDIAQVVLVENVIHAEIQSFVEIPPQCMFGNEKKQIFIDSRFVDIPLNGTFSCRYGRSPTCKRNIADSSSPRYRLIEH